MSAWAGNFSRSRIFSKENANAKGCTLDWECFLKVVHNIKCKLLFSKKKENLIMYSVLKQLAS